MLELVRKKKLGTSGLRLQPQDRNVETEKKGTFSPHYEHNASALYTVRSTQYTATRVTLLMALFAARQILNTHAQNHAMFCFYSF
jgi:hypothetical protein